MSFEVTYKKEKILLKLGLPFSIIPAFMGFLLCPFYFLTGMDFSGSAVGCRAELLAIKQSPFGYVMGAQKHIRSLVCFLSVVFQCSLAFLASVIDLLCRTPVKIVELLIQKKNCGRMII